MQGENALELNSEIAPAMPVRGAPVAVVYVRYLLLATVRAFPLCFRILAEADKQFARIEAQPLL